jgi:carboxyl-terminal processing protease
MITLPSFYSDFNEAKVSCSLDVERILKRMVEEKIDGLILDLRNNGGGSLEEARRMTGYFIGRGPVVQVKNFRGQIQVKESDAGKLAYTGPIVVVIDKNSAAASEILAGALQDYKRAVIVGGASSFGCGTVQQPMDIGRMLPPEHAGKAHAGSLKFTIQKFYRPSGSSTQLNGVASDIILPSLADTMENGMAFLRHPLAHDTIPAVEFKAFAAQSLFIPRLKELSQERVNASRDFFYVIEEMRKAKNRLKTNRLSLIKSIRDQELAESDAFQKSRNAERRARFAKISEEDQKTMSFFEMTLEGLVIRRAKDETHDLSKDPRWPAGLDPVKREAIMIARDLVDMQSGK